MTSRPADGDSPGGDHPPAHGDPPGGDHPPAHGDLPAGDHPPADRPSAGGTATVAWFHCFAGIAGDMALGGLLDAGADLGEVRGLLERLPFSGWGLDVEAVLRGGIAASRAVVTVRDDASVRTYADVVELVRSARLPTRVADRSLATFAALARVEARLHRMDVGSVHFHEVGGHDSIVDVVGTAAALEVLDVDEVVASPVATGLGTIRSAHGLLPNPAPAVVALLEGIPSWGRDVPVELTTPTGAALLAALATSFGPMPAMRIAGQGFGAGSRELEDLPNCTQVVIGSRAAPSVGGGQPVVTLEANLDDVTGEELATVIVELLAHGAHDAWVTPVVMKKGRPGHVLSVLTDPARSDGLRDLLAGLTGSFGVRGTTGERWPSARRMAVVDVDGQPIGVKVGARRVKAEYDDVVRAARATGGTVREIAGRAESLGRDLERSGDAPPERSPVED